MAFQLNRVIHVEDFREPRVRSVIREVFAAEAAARPDFPEGREERKHWEVAMAVLALRDGGVLEPHAELLGIGAGTEATSFWLTNHVKRVWATDRYGKGDEWEADAPTEMLTDPGTYWSGDWNPRRLVVQHADALELPYEDCSFDGIFSSGSFEHFGGVEQIRTAVDEAFRVLRPSGILSISTEFLLSGDPLAFEEHMVMFTPELIQDVFVGDRSWNPLTSPDWTVSTATQLTQTDSSEIRNMEDGEHLRYPHAVLRHGDCVFTSVHIALRKGSHTGTVLPAPPRALPASPPRSEALPLAALLPDPLVVVDGGCRWGFKPEWEELHPHVRLIGFDPDAEECARLEHRYEGVLDATIVPRALGAQRERRTFLRFGDSSTSSFHPHDENAMAHAELRRDDGRIERLEASVEVDMETLDGWCRDHGVERVDALKLDVQGHELEVLRGAPDALSGIRSIEVEVSLNPIMRDAPLFGEVDAFLRERGFYLWRLGNLAHYPIHGAGAAYGKQERVNYGGYGPHFWNAPPGFLLWCDAYYVRGDAFDPTAELPWATRLRDALIANALCFHDLAQFALRQVIAASPPAPVAEAAQAVLDAGPQMPVPAEEPAAGAEPEPETRPATRARRGGLLGRLARKPYWPVVWRLDRNHAWAQLRADGVDAQLDQLTARVDHMQAALATRLEALEQTMGANGGATDESLARTLGELRRVPEELSDAVIEWTTAIARAAERRPPDRDA